MKGLERTPFSKAFLAKEFSLDKPVKKAELIISADDTYEVWINGKAVLNGESLDPELAKMSGKAIYI